MTFVPRKTPVAGSPLIKPLYLIVVILLALSGFAQMPIMKRYYIADIPGLSWLADFYTTHTMHYILAAVLIFLLVYIVVVYLAVDRRNFKLTAMAMIRIVLMAILIASGVFRVLKNLPDIAFSPDFIVLIDFTHLGAAMILIFAGIVSLILRRRWVAQRQRI